MARQQNSAPPPPPPAPNAQPKDNQFNVSNAQNNPAQHVAAMNQTVPFPPIPPPPVNIPAAAAFAQQSQASSNGVQNFASNQTNPFAGGVPPIVPPASLDPGVQKQLMLIKALSDQGYPPDQIAVIIAAMGNQGPPIPGSGGIPPPPPQFTAQNQNATAQNGWGSRPDESRDRNGYHEAVRSPPGGRFRRRSRSPSPARAWNSRDSPSSRRRDEPNYDYDRDSPGRNRGDDRGRGRGRDNGYRQRSPPRRRSPTPPRNEAVKKWVSYDDKIGKGNIKGIAQKIHRPSEVLTKV